MTTIPMIMLITAQLFLLMGRGRLTFNQAVNLFYRLLLSHYNNLANYGT